MITLVIHGHPEPQPRAKATRCGGFVRMYTPDTADAWKAAVRAEARKAPWRFPKGVPVSLRIAFVLARPQAHFRRRKGIIELRDDAPLFVTTKPDADNLTKAVMDAMTQDAKKALGPHGWRGLWDDDCQVVYMEAVKLYGPDCGAVVEVGRMDGLPIWASFAPGTLTRSSGNGL